MPTVVLALIMATFTGVMIVGPSLAMNGFLYNPLFFGFVTGLVIGDVRSGFSIGATCMLMSLGFYTYGGATIPDYNVGAIYGTILAARGTDLDSALVVATALALLMSLFDILGRATTTVFQHGGDRALARRDVKAFERWHLMGVIPWFLGRFIPTFIGIMFIDQVEKINTLMAQYDWVRKGLSVIGKSLPAVGFALLLSYMDIKSYWPFMLLGYALFAYMGVPTLGLAIVGLAAAALFATKNKKEA